MLNIIKVPENGLNALLEDERDGLSDEAFVARYITALKTRLLSDPIRYRSFGAYWWPIKRVLMSDSNYNNEFGDSFDTDINKALSYESDALTVCAAFLEQEANIEEGKLKANEFYYDTKDGEGVNLVVEDDFMEKLSYLLNHTG